MSETKDPNGKGFLGDDLALDIEDWDRGFDSLIGEPAPTIGPDTSDIATIDVSTVDVDPDLATMELGDATELRHVGVEHDEDFADFADASAAAVAKLAQPSVATATLASPPAPAPTLPDRDPRKVATLRPETIAVGENDVEDSISTLDVDAPLRDSDFSMVGVQGSPTALGSLLAASAGRAVSSMDDVTNPRFRPVAARDNLSDTIDALDLDVAEDDVFTSASRPFPTLGPTNNTIGPDSDIDDPIAAPPPPVRQLPLAPPPLELEAKRTPAIVRRAGVVAATNDISGFAAENSSTRIVDLNEMGAQSALPSPATINVSIDEDAYDDIEIDASPSAELSPSVKHDVSAKVEASVRAEPLAKRTAHIVRRGESSVTAAPPLRYESAPIIEVDGGTGPRNLAAPDPVSAEPDRAKRSTGRFGGKATTPPPLQGPAQDALVDEFADFADASVAPVPAPEPAVDFANDPRVGTRSTPSDDDSLDIDIGGSTLLGMVAAPDDGQGSFDDDSVAMLDRAETRVRATSASPVFTREFDTDAMPDADVVPSRTPTIMAHGASPIPSEYVPARPAIAELTGDRSDSGDAVTWTIDPAMFAEQGTAAPQTEDVQAEWLAVVEREIAIVDDVAVASALRSEAGRVSERIDHVERARQHYEAALLDDPSSRSVLQGLRGLAMRAHDTVEIQRLLELEQALVSDDERALLARHRVDLLMAAGELDLARVAVGEILDAHVTDVPSLFAQLELTLCDGRIDEFAATMALLDGALTDPTLRAGIALARAGVSLASDSDHGAVMTAAHQADSSSPLLMMELARVALLRGQRDAAAVYYAGMADLLMQQTTAGDSHVSAAARLRSLQLGDAGGPGLPDTWTITSPAANALVMQLPQAGEATRGRAAVAVAQVAPGQDLALESLRSVAALTNAQSGAADWAALFDHVELAAYARQKAGHPPVIGADAWSDAAEYVRTGQLGLAQQTLAGQPSSPSHVALMAPQLLSAGQHQVHVELLTDACNGPVGSNYYRLRANLAALFADVGEAQAQDRRASWQLLFDESQPVLALAALNTLAPVDAVAADQLWDALTPEERLARALRAARTCIAAGDAAGALLELERCGDDRSDTRWVAMRTLVAVLGPAGDRSTRAMDVAKIFEDAANTSGDTNADAIAALRLRTAQLFLDGGAAAEATVLFEQVENRWPASALVSDLHALASRRAGQDVAVSDATSDTAPRALSPEVLRNPAARDHAYARLMRQADVYVHMGDHAAAEVALAAALELRPGDPGATSRSEQLAQRHGNAALAAVRAVGRVQFADQLGDPATIADAQVQLADIELLQLGNVEAARAALQIAYECAPQRWSTLDRMLMVGALRNDAHAIAVTRQRQAELAATDSEYASYHFQDAAATLESIGADSRRILDLSRKALHNAPPLRGAMLFAERAAHALNETEELATNDDRIAAYFAGDARSQAAFLTRAGVYWSDAGQLETAIARFRAAEAVMPAYIPALEGWRRASLRGQLWIDVANAALREAIATHEVQRRTQLFHLAGVVLMEKALVPERAIEAFRYVLDADPSHRDAFLRMRILLSEEGNHDELAIVLEQRLAVEQAPMQKRELHRAVAELHRNFLSNREGAMTHYREILRIAPNDIGAQTALADIAWELGDWPGAASALIARARLERSPDVLRSLSKRLGMLYADRLGEPATALAWFERSLAQAPDDEDALIRVAELAGKAGDWNRAMAAAERLVKNEEDAEARVAHWHRVAEIFEAGFGDAKRAERAYNQALDGAPSSAPALDGLIKFYKRRSDTVSIRVHLGRVASAVRARIEAHPNDVEAYRVLARTMEARDEAGVDGSLAIARSAHDMVAIVTGHEVAVPAKTPMIPTPSSLLTVEADEVIYPAEVQPELRQLFQLLGERLAKHIGVDLRHHGVTRSDKVGSDQPVVRAALTVAGALGFADIEVYVSQRQPLAFAAEPTNPLSLVIGSTIAASDRDAIRFATGAALKLAQSQLAVAGRLPASELGVLVIALVRLFQPDFPAISVDLDAVATQMQRLRRLIPSNAMNDLRPFALAIDASRFNHVALSSGLAMASYRAGVASAQSLSAGLKVLAARAGMPVATYINEPVARALIQWALSEDHGIVAR